MAIDSAAFRATMAARASGVAIVTARAGERVHGMTVTDYAGVSLDPPLVLVCADKSSNTLPLIQAGGNFALNLLAAGQQELSNRFASKRDEWRRFDGLECGVGATGAPLLPGTVASLDCTLVSVTDAGDHLICVGRVEHVTHRAAEPLVHHAGRYRALVEEE